MLDGTVKNFRRVQNRELISAIERHLGQVEAYASSADIRCVLLTNRIARRLYHMTFAESAGIRMRLRSMRTCWANSITQLRRLVDSFGPYLVTAWKLICLSTVGSRKRR